jgi:hypothetical protein
MSPNAYDFSTPTHQSIHWTKVYSGQQYWMDRERPCGLGIVHEKVVHTETPGIVSRVRVRLRITELQSNQLSQPVVANAKLIASCQSRTLRPQEGNTSNTPWIANSRILQWQSSNLQLDHAVSDYYLCALYSLTFNIISRHTISDDGVGSLQWTSIDGFGK